MTNTTPEAVERLSWSPTDMVQMNGHGSYVYYADYAALSAQLEAANKRTAQARYEALMEAAGCIGHITRHEDLDAIFALIPADLPLTNAQIMADPLVKALVEALNQFTLAAAGYVSVQSATDLARAALAALEPKP